MAGIDNIRSGQAMATTSRQPGRSESSRSNVDSDSVTKSTNKQDAVTLSQQGKEIGQMHQKMAATPSFDSAKVAAIKDAIANGSYSVNAEKLADNMIKFEKEFGGFN